MRIVLLCTHSFIHSKPSQLVGSLYVVCLSAICMSCMSFDITCTCVCVYVCVCVCVYVIFLLSFSVCYLFICISLQFGGIKVEIQKKNPFIYTSWFPVYTPQNCVTPSLQQYSISSTFYISSPNYLAITNPLISTTNVMSKTLQTLPQTCIIFIAFQTSL